MDPLLAAIIGALIGIVAVWVAAWRSACQPTGVVVGDEATVISAVLADPGSYRLLTVLEAGDFAVSAHRALWERLGELAVDDEDEAHRLEAQQADVPCRTLEQDAGELAELLAGEGLLDGITTGRAAERDELLRAGRAVQAAAGDRELVGLVPPVEDPEGAEPFVRVRQRPGPVRSVVSVLGGAAGAWLVAAGSSSVWAAAAGLCLIAGSAVCALVDLDTLYIDASSLAVASAAAIALAVISVHADWWPPVRTGLIVVIVVVGSLELLSVLWTKVHHSVGIGGGDGVLLLPVLFVPVVATGRWEAGLWGLIASLVLTIAGQCTLIALGRSSRDAPFAWGPYLVLGWPIGWYLAATVGAG